MIKINTILLKPLVLSAALLPLVVFSLFATEGKSASGLKVTEKGKAAIQKIIFEEQKIEGKIRRPQMVLIKADQRPSFPPMIMQSAGKNDNVASSIDPSIIESPAYKGAFQFRGTAIINYVP
jgi:hypothetical protein